MLAIVDARHQAQRGRPRPHRAALGDARALARRRSMRGASMTARCRRSLVDANTEYLLYQTLVGAWPARRRSRCGRTRRRPCARPKAAHVVDGPGRGLRGGAARLRRGARSRTPSFVARPRGVRRPVSRRRWQISSLAQTLLKLTAPGVPDIYQGTEIWDSQPGRPRQPPAGRLRPARARSWSEARSCDRAGGDCERASTSGLPKIWLIARVLALRARRPELFDESAAYRR